MTPRSLEALKRHKVWIVSKTSNANAITHYVQASLKTARRVIADLSEQFPSAEVGARSVALVSAIGRDLKGLRGVRRSLAALEDAGIEVIAQHQTPRHVNLDFVVPAEQRDAAVAALHKALIEEAETPLPDQRAGRLTRAAHPPPTTT